MQKPAAVPERETKKATDAAVFVIFFLKSSFL
jgi:hypothetical protein